MGLPSLPGYVEAGGWLFGEKEIGRALEPPPRRFGLHEYVMNDIRAVRPLFVWGMAIGLFAYGIVTTNWIVAAAGALIFGYFFRGAAQNYRVIRHGVLGVGRVEKIDANHGLIAEAHDVPVDGSSIIVQFDPEAVEFLLNLGPVDVLMFYDPKKTKRRYGTGFMLRPASDEPLELDALREAVARLRA